MPNIAPQVECGAAAWFENAVHLGQREWAILEELERLSAQCQVVERAQRSACREASLADDIPCRCTAKGQKPEREECQRDLVVAVDVRREARDACSNSQTDLYRCLARASQSGRETTWQVKRKPSAGDATRGDNKHERAHGRNRLEIRAGRRDPGRRRRDDRSRRPCGSSSTTSHSLALPDQILRSGDRERRLPRKRTRSRGSAIAATLRLS